MVIKIQAAQTVGATLRYTSGVIGDVNGGADTRFGGLQIRDFDTTQQGLYLDGLRLPNTPYVQFLGLDPYGAERIELLKGSSSVMFGGSGPANKEGTALWRLTGMVRDGGSQVDFVRDNRVFIAPAVTFKPNEDTTLTLLANYRLALNVTNIADTRYVASCYSTVGCFYADARKAVAKLTYRW